jgi:predicted small secreted protein
MKKPATTTQMKPHIAKGFMLLACALSLAACSSGNSSEGLGVYPKAMGAADEAFAIQALRTIATAETQLKATRGSYGDFNALTQAGVLDQRFAAATPNLKGYRFTITATDSDFSVAADPQMTETQPTTGSRHFYLDSSDNAVHANPKQAASKNDPVVGV